MFTIEQPRLLCVPTIFGHGAGDSHQNDIVIHRHTHSPVVYDETDLSTVRKSGWRRASAPNHHAGVVPLPPL